MNSCPKCKSSKVIPIIYGMPSYELTEDERKGKAIIGGCVIDEEPKDCHCKECGLEWNNK